MSLRGSRGMPSSLNLVSENLKFRFGGFFLGGGGCDFIFFLFSFPSFEVRVTDLSHKGFVSISGGRRSKHFV